MATGFPTSLDSFTNPNHATDNLDSTGVEHDLEHANANDAIAALEAKVGITNSAVTTSLDYLVKHSTPKRTTVADANYTILATDKQVSYTSLSAARVLTLPAASALSAGGSFNIVDESGSCSATNTITINRAGSDTIDGATSLVLVTAYAQVSLISDGTSKWVFDVRGVTRGGTGATSAAAGLVNLGGVPLSTGTTAGDTVYFTGSSTISRLAAGTAYFVYAMNAGATAPAWTDAYSLPQNLNAQTGTTYTHVLTDAGKLVTLSNASAITVTIDTNANVATVIGTRIDFIQIGAGQVTFVGGSGVTVSSTPTLKTRAQYSGVSIIKVGTNLWYLTGDLAAS